ncbi:helix-turn-helix transcriptional regulator [Pseudonocardia sp. D17]|uniref:helix-turn-helix transcriptional regulator n=1 Tax=Pseudonocardia sp. D17 TaxID=882661 RepID=UPI002B3B4132|nr:hypothetical protein PSD17_56420 [Pseudonocardia sp. D17]
MTATTTAPVRTRIADLLADGQARTARDIATAIEAGYSTVGKTLAVMAAEGQAVKADGAWTLVADEADTADAEAAAWLDARHAEAQPVAEAAPADSPSVKLSSISTFNVRAAQATGLVTASGPSWAILRGTVAEVLAAAEATLSGIRGRGERQAMHTVIRKLRNADPRYVRVIDAPNANIDRDAAVQATAELAMVDEAVAAHVATMRRAAAAEGRAMGTTGQYRSDNTLGRDLWVYVARDEYAAILDGPDAEAAPVKAPRPTKLPLKGRGDLRADVLAWLTENPGTEITPAKLARIMGGRSSGAILKGLNRLVADGHAVQTSAAPRTYRLA